jgi:hypothetical protein
MMPLLNCPNPELLLSLLLLVADFFLAYMLEAIGRHVLLSPNPIFDKEETEQDEIPEAIRPQYAHIFPITRKPSGATAKSLLFMESVPLLAAQIYYWSPFVALSGGIYQCFQNLPALFMVGSLYESLRQTGSYSLSAFFLAIATYMEPHNAVFLVPITLWISQQHQPSTKNNQLVLLISFGIWSTLLQGLSYSLVGPTKYWDVISTVYGCGWRNMSPNLSVQWYFNMQLFSRFREYFGAILTGLPYILVGPLAIRLHRYPMVLVSDAFL